MALITDPDDLSQGAVTAVSDLTFGSTVGAQTTLGSTGASLPTIAAGEYLAVRGHPTAGNNGLYIVDTYTSGSSITVTKQALDGSVVNPTDDATGRACTVLGSTATVMNCFIDYSLSPPMIQLIKDGALSDDGVTGQAFYSFLKEEWKDDADLIKFPFPMTAITPEQFEFNSDWEPADASEASTVTGMNTRELFRAMGWDEINNSDNLKRTYLCAVTLGNIDFTNKTTGDKPYYFWAGDTSATEAVYAGPMNEAIQVVGIIANGGNVDIDHTADELTIRIRVFGKTYDESTSTAIGQTSLANQTYRFPLSETTDAVINDLVTTTVSDLFDDIITVPVAPYNDMSITYFATDQDRSGFNPLGGDTPSPGDAQFGVIVDGDVSIPQQDGGGAATAEEIYAYVQARLSEATDIDDGGGSLAGQLAEELLSLASTGNTLSSIGQSANHAGGGTGVYVDSFSNDDVNRVSFIDGDGDARTFPFVASFTINFNSNLVNDTGPAEYWVFFTTNPGGNWGTIDAIIVDDNAGTDIQGTISGATANHTFDYDGNTQGGRGSGADADITIVAIGLDTANHVVATGTIIRATGQSFSLVAALERNYSNAP